MTRAENVKCGLCEHHLKCQNNHQHDCGHPRKKELLIQFVQKLLCPECRKPLGENKRCSCVTEHRTDQAAKVVFTCQSQHKVDLFTSKKCEKVYESNRRFPLAIFSLGKNNSGAKCLLSNMNLHHTTKAGKTIRGKSWNQCWQLQQNVHLRLLQKWKQRNWCDCFCGWYLAQTWFQ